jgi:hypothetical protein
MPNCASAAAGPIMVHVPPYGYASQDGSLSVRGVLGVTALSGPMGAGVPANGSAAGGVRLTISGSGFEPNATRMKVPLRLLTAPLTTPFTTPVTPYLPPPTIPLTTPLTIPLTMPLTAPRR